MPEWLKSPFAADLALDTTIVAWRLAMAFVLGFVVAGVCALTSGKPSGAGRSFLATIVLLTILICMMTMVIGDNVARAFSLVGALAIVRFRTIVEDTRDTAFVIFAVSVGMAVGSGYLLLPVIAIPIAAAAALIFRTTGARMLGAGAEYTLIVRTNLSITSDAAIQSALAALVSRIQPVLTATARQGTAFERTYTLRVREPDGATAIISALNAIEGVQGVELRPTGAA